MTVSILSTVDAAAAKFSFVFVCRRSEVRSVTLAQVYNLLQVKITTCSKYTVDLCRNESPGSDEENIHYNMNRKELLLNHCLHIVKTA